MKGRIKIGSPIFQDHHFLKWPECLPPESEYKGEEYQYITKHPDTIFDIKKDNTSWVCIADGYGALGNYGNGSIYVNDEKFIEFITPIDIQAEEEAKKYHQILREVLFKNGTVILSWPLLDPEYKAALIKTQRKFINEKAASIWKTQGQMI